MRYYFCHKANDHEVGNQSVDITVNGLEYSVPTPDPEEPEQPEQPETKVVYSLTETRLTSSDLMSKTEPTLIAIKNLSKTNNF